MKLFLCSHFSSVGSLIKEEIENKKVAFIPTASIRYYLQKPTPSTALTSTVLSLMSSTLSPTESSLML